MSRTVVDLFAGAGGFSLGFHQAGFEILAALEKDEWACETLEANKHVPLVIQRDIEELILEEEIKAIFGNITTDVVIGGPPCQGFSRCNAGTGDSKDPRNSLFVDFIRVAKALEPKIIIMENVPDLLKKKTADGDMVIDLICSSIKSAGYHDVTYEVLKATNFGVPQIRERLFVYASRVGRMPEIPKTHSVDPDVHSLLKTPTLWDAISDLPQLKAREGAEEQEYTTQPTTELQSKLRGAQDVLLNHKAMNHYKSTVNRFEAMEWGTKVADLPPELRPKKRGSDELAEVVYDQNNRRMRPDVPCHTIPASFYANFVHPYCHRNFTAREGARIQTFPDSYVFKGKPTVISKKLLIREGRHAENKLCQYNQVGNAVPPLLAEAIARQTNYLLL